MGRSWTWQVIACGLALAACAEKESGPVDAVGDERPELRRTEDVDRNDGCARDLAELTAEIPASDVWEWDYYRENDKYEADDPWQSFGEPCTTDADCTGCLFCVPTQLGSICTCGPCNCCEECVEFSAPLGMVVSCDVGVPPDIKCACVPMHGCMACWPCKTDLDCAGPSGPGLCLEIQGEQRACAEGCWGGKLCLPDMECATLVSPDGQEAKVCVSPDTGTPAKPGHLCVPTCCEGLEDGTPCDDGSGRPYTACQSGVCVATCTPSCTDKQCGGNGCGGSCGTCDDGDVCTDDICDPLGQGQFTANGACPADCPGPNPQGCASTGCPAGQECAPTPGVCVPSSCSCEPVLGAWACTPDCSGGTCVCIPKCTGKECGDDGCGGSCGECAQELACDFLPGKCKPVPGDMVLVPSGHFWMGCNVALDTLCQLHEYPYHEVHVDAFLIDKTEVTVNAYGACAEAGGCTAPATWPGACNWSKAGTGQHPVNCVDWQQAVDYCQWAGKRLCKEAEWEKAARGPDGALFPWGNGPGSCDLAVMYGQGTPGCGSWTTWEVGSKPEGASPYGALDMAGNVCEWTADWYDEAYYSGSPASNPPGPACGVYRVNRGGGLLDSAFVLRCSERGYGDPLAKETGLGIRCCKSLAE